MAGLTQEQFMQLMGNKQEPVTSSIASVLNLIKKPLDYYAFNKNVPLVGGQSVADLTGLTGTQSLIQDFSQGKPMMQEGLPDPRFMDVAGILPMVKPAAIGAGQAAKYIGKEALRQGYEGTGLLGKIAPDVKSNLFVGETSKSWNTDNANKAMQMAKQGIDERKIWADTGTFKGPDNQWRQEISDMPAKFNTAQDLSDKAKAIKLQNENLKLLLTPVKNQKDLFPKHLTEARRPIKEQIQQNVNLLDKNFGLTYPPLSGNYANLAFEHPELYNAYPDMERIIISQGLNKGEGNFGAYMPSKQSAGYLQVHKAALDKNTKGIPEWGGKSTSLHELQHAIQDREGFGSGGSPEEMQQNLLNERYQLNTQLASLNDKMSELAKADKMSPDAKAAYDMLMEQRMQLVPRVQQLQDNAYIGAESFNQYKNLLGEAEARAAQARMNMTPQERLAKFPFDSYDVPRQDLILHGLLNN